MLGLLDELLHHQDDPLYWIQPSSSTVDTSSRTTTPQPLPQAEIAIFETSSDQSIPLANEQPMSDMHTHGVDDDLDRRAQTISHQEEMHRFSRAGHDGDDNDDDSGGGGSSNSAEMSPPREQQAEVQHTQSFFTTSSLSSRWVPSFLASAARSTLASSYSVASGSSSSSGGSGSRERGRSASPIATTTIAAPRSFEATATATLPTRLPSQLRDALQAVAAAPSAPTTTSHVRAQTLLDISTPASAPAAPPLDVVISHGTPFASHPYVPPSGAPGFEGDRAWDKGFEFDQMGIEARSVKLLGRRELTTPVLTAELADLVSLHFLLVFFPRPPSLSFSFPGS